jgi:transcriptional regulator with XRE-family HTH domain
VLRLKYERLRSKISSTKLALLVHIHQPTLSLIENGRLIPTAPQLARLAAVFNIPGDELIQPIVLLDGKALALCRVGRLHLKVIELEREAHVAANDQQFVTDDRGAGVELG